MDRLTSLTAFVRVVDSGGFSAAGRRLNMSTTMVSNHVQALEERLGARLLHRTTRKVSLTEVGKAYYDRCTQILADIEQADDIAGALQSTPRGTLRIYTATHIVQFVAPVVAEFLIAYPEAKVDLTIGEREVDLIDEGFDIAIRLIPPPDSSLIVRSLATWRHVLCCSPAYLEKHGPLRQLTELSDHNCVRHVLYPFEDEHSACAGISDRRRPRSRPSHSAPARVPAGRICDECGLSAPSSPLCKSPQLHRSARAPQRRAAEADQSVFLTADVSPAIWIGLRQCINF